MECRLWRRYKSNDGVVKRRMIMIPLPFLLDCQCSLLHCHHFPLSPDEQERSDLRPSPSPIPLASSPLHCHHLSQQETEAKVPECSFRSTSLTQSIVKIEIVPSVYGLLFQAQIVREGHFVGIERSCQEGVTLRDGSGDGNVGCLGESWKKRDSA